MTSLVDLFPNFLRQGCRRELLLLAICSICCLLGLSLVTEVCAAHFFTLSHRDSLADIHALFIGRDVLAAPVGPSCLQWHHLAPPFPLPVSQHRLGVRSVNSNCFNITRVFEADFADCLVPEGSERFYQNITDMIGYRPNPFMKYCWTYITPFICFVSILSEIVQMLTIY